MQGILSFHQLVIEIKYTKVLGVQIDQSILGRILNFGDVSVGTAESSQKEITLYGIANPLRFVEEIKRRMDMSGKGEAVTITAESQSVAAASVGLLPNK